jgi:hypothetical protein
MLILKTRHGAVGETPPAWRRPQPYEQPAAPRSRGPPRTPAPAPARPPSSVLPAASSTTCRRRSTALWFARDTFASTSLLQGLTAARPRLTLQHINTCQRSQAAAISQDEQHAAHVPHRHGLLAEDVVKILLLRLLRGAPRAVLHSVSRLDVVDDVALHTTNTIHYPLDAGRASEGRVSLSHSLLR